MVKASVSDPFDGCDIEQGAVEIAVAAAAAAAEERLHALHTVIVERG